MAIELILERSGTNGTTEHIEKDVT
jgi:hypothetical protein